MGRKPNLDLVHGWTLNERNIMNNETLIKAKKIQTEIEQNKQFLVRLDPMTINHLFILPLEDNDFPLESIFKDFKASLVNITIIRIAALEQSFKLL
jgi:hypothetical protein